VALVPFLVAVAGKPPLYSATLSCLTGGLFLRAIFYWINAAQGVTWTYDLALTFYFAAYFGLFGFTLGLASRRLRLPLLIVAPAAWVSAEYFRSNAGFLALPWGLLGHSQYRVLPLIQVASLAGAYGVSFLIVMVNAFVAECVLAARRPRSARYGELLAGASVTAVLLGLSLAFGAASIPRSPSGPGVTIVLVQGNIPQAERWVPDLRARNLVRHLQLSKEAARAGETDLIVWPETSVQGSLTEDLWAFRALAALARETRAYLLVGSATRPKFGPAEVRRNNRSNSAFLISPAGRLAGRYDKIRLLPFGEYLPYADRLPWPAGLASAAGNFVPGRDYTLLGLDGTQFGVAICWETIFPDTVRTFVERGAAFVVNIGNEAWFGESAAPYQFLAMNVFRAVENHIAIARASNTGVSALINPDGRIIDRVQSGGKDIFVAGALTGRVPTTRERTFYTRYGDVFAWTTMMYSLALLLRALARRRPHSA
jgi:apolipoprotein N-acyltransferase